MKSLFKDLLCKLQSSLPKESQLQLVHYQKIQELIISLQVEVTNNGIPKDSDHLSSLN